MLPHILKSVLRGLPVDGVRASSDICAMSCETHIFKALGNMSEVCVFDRSLVGHSLFLISKIKCIGRSNSDWASGTFFINNNKLQLSIQLMI